MNRKTKLPTWTQSLIWFMVSLILPIVLLVLWQYGVGAGYIKASIFPKPTVIWETFIEHLKNGKVWMNVQASMKRVIIGFACGSAIGLVLGIATGLWRSLYHTLSLVISLIRAIPNIALIPVFFMIFGIGEASKIALITLASFRAVFLNTESGVRMTDQHLQELAYVYRIPYIKKITNIVLPSAVPSILTGFRLAMNSSWMAVVGAEMFAASKGVGFMIANARELGQSKILYVYVLIIGLVGVILDKSLSAIQKYYLLKTRGTN